MRDEAMDTQSPYVPFVKTTSSNAIAEFNTPKLPQQTASCLSGLKKSNSCQMGEINSPINFTEATTAYQNQTNQEIVTNTSKNSAAMGASLLPLDLIKEVIKDQIEDLRDELMSENFKFKAEMIKEFMSLKVSFTFLKS
jgi:hypothetical protein